jgi:hypothetical protein
MRSSSESPPLRMGDRIKARQAGAASYFGDRVGPRGLTLKISLVRSERIRHTLTLPSRRISGGGSVGVWIAVADQGSSDGRLH